jgi:hypothetical protein
VNQSYWRLVLSISQRGITVNSRQTTAHKLSLLGDLVFLYDKDKELELQEQHGELWYKDYKKKKRQHIHEIVDALTMSEKEIMREEFGTAIQIDSQNRCVERIIMPNFFDMRRNSHNHN